MDDSKAQSSIPTHRNLDLKRASAFVAAAKNRMELLGPFFADCYGVFSGIRDEHIRRFSITNCLTLIFLLVETCEYVPLALTQIYLLDFIERLVVDIAYVKTFFSEPTRQSYFPNRNLHEMGVQLQALKIIGVCSRIKPNRVYMEHELSEQSLFSLAFSRLKQKLKYSDTLEIIAKKMREEKTYNAEKLHEKHYNNLYDFFVEDNPARANHQEFFIHQLCTFIERGQHRPAGSRESDLGLPETAGQWVELLNIHQYLKRGDGGLTGDCLGICVEIIEKEQNISFKNNALSLIGQLVLWGDMEALLLVNYSGVFEGLCDSIEKKEGSRSWTIFPQLSQQEHQKKQFLTDLFKYTELWGRLMPFDNLIRKENTVASPISKVYHRLEELFGKHSNATLDGRLIDEFAVQLSANKLRNQKVLESLYQQSVSVTSRRTYTSRESEIQSPSDLGFSSIAEEDSLTVRADIIDNVREAILSIQSQLAKLLASPSTSIGQSMLKLKKQCANLERELLSLSDSNRRSSTSLGSRDQFAKSNVVREAHSLFEIKRQIEDIHELYLTKGLSNEWLLSQFKALQLNQLSRPHHTADGSSEESIKSFIVQKYRGDGSMRSSAESKWKSERRDLDAWKGDQSEGRIHKVRGGLTQQFPIITRRQLTASLEGNHSDFGSGFKQISQSCAMDCLPMSKHSQVLASQFPLSRFQIKSSTASNQSSTHSKSKQASISDKANSANRPYIYSGDPSTHDPSDNPEGFRLRRNLSVATESVKQFSVSQQSFRTVKNEQFDETSSVQTSRRRIFSKGKQAQMASRNNTDYIFSHSDSPQGQIGAYFFRNAKPPQSRNFFHNGRMIKWGEIAENIAEQFDERTKKKLWRSKNLVIRNDQIQIGSVWKREVFSVAIKYFVTPFKQVYDFVPKISFVGELSVKVHPIQEAMERGRQYRLCIAVEIIEFKYRLPAIEFNYKWAEGNKHFGPYRSISLLPALSINFLDLKPIEYKELSRQFALHSCQFIEDSPLDRPIYKSKRLNNINACFPNLTLLNQEGSVCIYGLQCVFKKLKFILQVNIDSEEGTVGLAGVAHDQKSKELMRHCLCMYWMLLRGEPAEESEIKSSREGDEKLRRSAFKKKKQ